MKTSHLIAVAALAISFAIPGSLFAASTPTVEEDPVEESKPYISSRPTDGVFKVVVLGDSLADGLYSGLSRLNSKNDQLKIKKASLFSGRGFFRFAVVLLLIKGRFGLEGSIAIEEADFQ